MKSKLFPIILGLSVFLMISCNNDATDSQASLPSNLPESKGQTNLQEKHSKIKIQHLNLMKTQSLKVQIQKFQKIQEPQSKIIKSKIFIIPTIPKIKH